MEIEQALKWADTCGLIPSHPPNGDAQALMALAAEVRKLREERDAAFAMSKCECETNECCANLMRYRVALEAATDLANWHTDDDADPEDTSPEDAVAHTNGLIRQICKRALMWPNVEGNRLAAHENETGAMRMEQTTNDSSAACGQSALTAGLTRTGRR